MQWDRKTHIKKIVEENREYFLEIFKNAIDIVTVNPPGNEDELADYIKSVLEKEQISVRLLPVEKGRSNVEARYQVGNGGKKLLLNAHMDTVSVGGQKWDTDPFKAVIKDGRLYGRGSADDKGGLIAMLSALIVFKRLNLEKVDGELIFCGVMGEEASGIGTEHLVKNIGKADAAIVGEPSKLQTVVAHRGAYRVQYAFYGESAHSSEPDYGKNAIYYASNFALAIQEYNERLKQRENPLTGSPTIAVTIMNAGEKMNVIPDKATVIIDRRIAPEENLADVKKELNELLEKLKKNGKIGEYEEEKCVNYKGPAKVEEEEPIVLSVKEVLKEHGMDTKSYGMRATTDMYLLTDSGIPTLIWAPGDMGLAHTRNESIPVDEFIESIGLYVEIFLKYFERV